MNFRRRRPDPKRDQWSTWANDARRVKLEKSIPPVYADGYLQCPECGGIDQHRKSCTTE